MLAKGMTTLGLGYFSRILGLSQVNVNYFRLLALTSWPFLNYLFKNNFNNIFHSILFCISFRCTAQWLDNHTFYKVFPPNSSPQLAPHKAITILLTTFSMLYFTSPLLFCYCQSVLLNPSPCSPSPPGSLPPVNHYSVICIYESISVSFVCLYCSLNTIYKWSHMVFVFQNVICLDIYSRIYVSHIHKKSILGTASTFPNSFYQIILIFCELVKHTDFRARTISRIQILTLCWLVTFSSWLNYNHPWFLFRKRALNIFLISLWR